MNIKSIIESKDAVSLLLLQRINFNAGLSMMKTLRAEEKKRASKAEEDVWSKHAGDEWQDEFEKYAPQGEQLVPLDKSVNLIAASLMLAHEINGEGYDFYKSNLRTPKQVIVNQMDWMADKQAMSNLAIAQKMGVEVSVDKFKSVIKAKQAEKLRGYVVEAQSARNKEFDTMEARHLIHYIEENYNNPKWITELEDSAIRLYEAAVKRLNDGKFADLPGEVVEFAKAALARKGK